MSLQVRIGHIYTPPTDRDDATIYDWYSGSQRALEGMFIKVAHVLPLQENTPTPATENVFESVYVDIRERPNLAPAFTVPNGWKQLCVYMDDDMTMRPVIQKIVKPESNFVLSDPHAPLSAPLIDPLLNDAGFDSTGFDGESYGDDFMSVMSQFDAEITFGIGLPAIENNMPLALAAATTNSPPPVHALMEMESESNPVPQDLSTFLPRPTITSTALENAALVVPHFVICDPGAFTRGIKYDRQYIGSTFRVAAICISDASVLAKQRLNINGLKERPDSFRSACEAHIGEAMLYARHAGQPVEQGIQCEQTNDTKLLNMGCKDIVDMVYSERSKFVKSLKEVCLTLVNEPRRMSSGGFGLNDYNDEMVVTEISQLTGLTAWNAEVTSIEFTRSVFSGRYYRRMPILIILALRILQPLRFRRQSLLDLFPTTYKDLPKPLIANVCGMYVIHFKRRLPGCPWTRISSATLARESEYQLSLLGAFLQTKNTNLLAHELDSWLHTRDGPDGWLGDLQQALNLVNGERGPRSENAQ